MVTQPRPETGARDKNGTIRDMEAMQCDLLLLPNCTFSMLAALTLHGALWERTLQWQPLNYMPKSLRVIR